jgi:hypothetical protein
LKARLIHHAFGENKGVGIRDRVGVAAAALQRFCEAIAATKCPQVDQPPSLIDDRGVVHRTELMIDTSGDAGVL